MIRKRNYRNTGNEQIEKGRKREIEKHDDYEGYILIRIFFLMVLFCCFKVSFYTMSPLETDRDKPTKSVCDISILSLL